MSQNRQDPGYWVRKDNPSTIEYWATDRSAGVGGWRERDLGSADRESRDHSTPHHHTSTQQLSAAAPIHAEMTPCVTASKVWHGMCSPESEFRTTANLTVSNSILNELSVEVLQGRQEGMSAEYETWGPAQALIIIFIYI